MGASPTFFWFSFWLKEFIGKWRFQLQSPHIYILSHTTPLSLLYRHTHKHTHTHTFLFFSSAECFFLNVKQNIYTAELPTPLLYPVLISPCSGLAQCVIVPLGWHLSLNALHYSCPATQCCRGYKYSPGNWSIIYKAFLSPSFIVLKEHRTGSFNPHSVWVWTFACYFLTLWISQWVFTCFPCIS